MSSSSALTKPYSAYITSPMLVAFTFAVVVMCFVCFSVVYFCRCYFVSVIHTWAFHSSTSGTIVRLSPSTNDTAAGPGSPFRGLEPSLLETYPTFPYSSVKERRKEKNRCGLECAICLLEFDDDSMLRLLTVCCHVFHQECIDLWLRSHKTCPVCRTDLDSVTNGAVGEEGSGCDACVVHVKEGEGEGEGGGERFTRSHSTGHSIVMVRDEVGREDRYRLRLQENWVRGGHKYSKSCSSYKEMAEAASGVDAPCSNCGYVQPPLVSACSSIIIGGTTHNV